MIKITFVHVINYDRGQQVNHNSQEQGNLVLFGSITVITDDNNGD